MVRLAEQLQPKQHQVSMLPAALASVPSRLMAPWSQPGPAQCRDQSRLATPAFPDFSRIGQLGGKTGAETGQKHRRLKPRTNQKCHGSPRGCRTPDVGRATLTTPCFIKTTTLLVTEPDACHQASGREVEDD